MYDFKDDIYYEVYEQQLLCMGVSPISCSGLVQSERAGSIAVAKALWEELGDVCVDDDGCIDADWRDYPAGTDREDIWRDIEEQYGEHGVTVARLMGIEPWPD